MKHPIDLGRRNPHCQARWHGTESAYRHGCRCPHAREDHRIRDKRRRQGRATPPLIDGVGVARRIQALARIGYRYADIAAHLGTSWQYVQKLALRDNPTCTRRTHARVAAAYRHLSGAPGPSAQSRRLAQARGWPSPAAWGDDIDNPTARPDVDPAVPDPGAVSDMDVALVVAGKAPFTALHTEAEQAAAVGRLVAAGLGRSSICTRLGIGYSRYGRLAGHAAAGQAAA